MPPQRIRSLVVFACLARCGGQDCLSLAQEYAKEMPAALQCDLTASTDQCGAGRPVVDYVLDGGTMTIDGLGSCLHSMNPSRTGKLDQILAHFYSNGCKLLPLPVCPAVVDRCYLNNQNMAVCWQ